MTQVIVRRKSSISKLSTMFSSTINTFQFYDCRRMVRVYAFCFFLGCVCLLWAKTAFGVVPRTVMDMESLGASDKGSTDVFWKGDNVRFKVDVAGRVIHYFNNDNNVFVSWVGLDYQNVLSGLSGDVGTFTLQPYLTYVDSPNQDELKLIFRIFNFNYTALFQGKLNFKAGHFEVPFGLEHEINTNGTLRQYTNPANFGLKGDWGISLNGVLEDGNYEISLTRGTGRDWSNTGNPFVLAGRFASPGERDFQMGVSFLIAEVQKLSAPGFTVARNRAGLDVTYGLGAFTLLAETSIGDEEGREQRSSLLEFNWMDKQQDLMVYNQLRYFRNEIGLSWNKQIVNVLGVRYTPGNAFSVSMQWSKSLSDQLKPEVNVVASQLRYRF